ncbi:DUF3780 domain-containing protein [Fibrella sp. ES10-3-2-2]|nr:hypothetical protein A6C57_08610 [Fibrella sp. ES10-3-2-2]
MNSKKAGGPSQSVIGFGFRPAESEHHFLVNIQAKEVVIAERLDYDPDASLAELSYRIGRQQTDIKVIMHRDRWNLIAEHVRVEFTRRLRQMGLPAAKWTGNRNYVSRLLGKELTLLAWAIEEADAGTIPNGVQNWLGLKPEERWWLFTMTNAATGHAIYGRGKGWRAAVRYALTDSPASALPPPTLLHNPRGESLFDVTPSAVQEEDPDTYGDDNVPDAPLPQYP